MQRTIVVAACRIFLCTLQASSARNALLHSHALLAKERERERDGGTKWGSVGREEVLHFNRPFIAQSDCMFA